MTGAGIEPATSSTVVRWLYHCAIRVNVNFNFMDENCEVLCEIITAVQSI